MIRNAGLKVLPALLICLSLLACGGKTTVTTIEQLEGTWEALLPSGAVAVLIVQPDGTMVAALGWERLEKGIFETFSFEIDNELIQVRGPLECVDSIGSYQGVIRSDGTLRLTTIDDSCSVRRRILDKSEPGNFEQYEVEWSRVED